MPYLGSFYLNADNNSLLVSSCIAIRGELALMNSDCFATQIEVKPKPIVTRSQKLSRASPERYEFTYGFVWLTELFIFVVIGQSDYFSVSECQFETAPGLSLERDTRILALHDNTFLRFVCYRYNVDKPQLTLSQ